MQYQGRPGTEEVKGMRDIGGGCFLGYFIAKSRIMVKINLFTIGFLRSPPIDLAMSRPLLHM